MTGDDKALEGPFALSGRAYPGVYSILTVLVEDEMHVAVRRYSLDPDIYDDLKERLEADFVPSLRHIDGFIAYYAVRTGNETLDTISVFETQDGERKSTQLATEFAKRNYPEKRVTRISLDEGSCLVEHHAPIPA